tara:strand:+ start:229 stop:546 length:318 start_codon:yes stop_codon:yes gene_type:complete
MIEDLLKALDEKDFAYFERTMHDEFVYVDDFSMETKEQWLESFKHNLSNAPDGFFKNQREIMLDRPEITTMSFVREIDGVNFKIINVALWKDGKAWRQIVNRVPV